MAPSSIIVVGGHGKVSTFFLLVFQCLPLKIQLISLSPHQQVALQFARLASKSYTITSLVRSQDHFSDITAVGATPKLLSLEDATSESLTKLFEGVTGVLFSAGAGGKGGPERTRAVDFDGAVKVCS